MAESIGYSRVSIYYLSQQLAMMNAYAYLCPVEGSIAFDQGMTELMRRREMYETSEALRSAVALAIQREQVGDGDEMTIG